MDFLQYLFEPTPTEPFTLYIPVLIVCGILFVGSFFVPYFYKNNQTLKGLIRYFPGRLRLSAILMLLYLGVRYQELPFLSMNFFFYLIIFIFLVFLAKLLYILLRKYPKAKIVVRKKPSSAKNSEYSKYLPTAKKKKKRKR